MSRERLTARIAHVGDQLAARRQEAASRPPLTTADSQVVQLRDSREARLDVLRRQVAAQVPPHFAAAVCDRPEVLAWVDGIASGTTPSRWLFLVGTTGTGKTHQAYGALRALAKRGHLATYQAVHAAALYASLRPRSADDPERELRKYATAGVLLLDDLGASKTSEWVEEITYRLVNDRYDDLLPTIITSNLTEDQLTAAVGERVVSRIVGMSGEPVVFATEDRRRRRGETA